MAKEVTTATTHVRNANAAEEKVLMQKVAPLFADGSDVQAAGVRFGRKVLRVKKGTRKSPPPKGILSDQQVAEIYKALGVAKPERKVAESKPKSTSKKTSKAKTSDVENDAPVVDDAAGDVAVETV